MNGLPRRASLALVCLLACPWATPLWAEALLSSERDISEAVDHYVARRLADAGVTPAPSATDENFIRRATLDLAGRIPTAAEVRAYIASTESDKRHALVDRLLASTEYVEHQANEFDTLLMTGTKSSVRDYLVRAFQAERTWDGIFRDMLLSDEAQQELELHQGFVRARIKDLDQLTNDVSMVFFGVNISCAQCHDHPLVDDWKQEHFYGLKSFLNRTFENGGLIGERPYGTVDYLTPGGQQRKAGMMFLTGLRIDEPAVDEPDNDGKKAEQEQLKKLAEAKQPPPRPAFSRRAKLLEVALDEQQPSIFARAIVNRVWYRLMGHGLVMPIDQMHSGNPASHPELLEWLARDTAEHGYDLTRLIRGLVLSDTYARDSRWLQGDRPPPELFAVASVRPLTPHQFAYSLRVATADPDYLGADVEPAKQAERLAALARGGRGQAGLFQPIDTDFQLSVSESLILSNGEQLARDLLSDGGDRLVGRLATTDDGARRIELSAWNVWSRAPDAEESELLTEFLAARADRPLESARDLVWLMLTGAEFRFNY